MIYRCCLKSPEDEIRLGEPTEITFDWFLDPVIHVRCLEEMEEMGVIQRDISEIADEILNWEEETLDDIQMDAEIREALQGQVD